MRSAVVSLSALTFLLAPAFSATLVTYNDKATFLGAITATTLVDFESAPIGSDYGAAGLTFNGVNFLGDNSGGNFYLEVTNGQAPFNFSSGQNLKLPYYNVGSRLITTFASSTAIGFDLMTVNPGGGSLVVTLPASLGGGSYTIAMGAAPSHKYFGITSDVAFTTLAIAIASPGPTSPFPLIDNLQLGTATVAAAPADTPEVATFVLIGSGLFLFRLKKNTFSASLA